MAADRPATAFDLSPFIRDIPDFPKPGILFKDITPLLADPAAFAASVDQLADRFRDERIDLIAAAEARGFIFAAPLAIALGAGFVPIRKPGKLPYHTVAQQYALEYGTDRLEMHRDGLPPGSRVLLVDDVLATGGTMRACCDLATGAGAVVVGCAFVIELRFLDGRPRLEPYPVTTLLSY
jgi:adenine phosphoribosyltransferase